MSLEKDIQQIRKFRNEHHKAIVNIIYTYHWVTDKIIEFVEPHGLTLQQYNILRILRGNGGPLSTLQIRERLLDKMSDTSRIVDRLIIKKLVKKIISKKDKRLVDVSITLKGKALLAKLDESPKAIDSIVKNLTKAEAKQVSSLMDKIRLSN